MKVKKGSPSLCTRLILQNTSQTTPTWSTKHPPFLPANHHRIKPSQWINSCCRCHPHAHILPDHMNKTNSSNPCNSTKLRGSRPLTRSSWHTFDNQPLQVGFRLQIPSSNAIKAETLLPLLLQEISMTAPLTMLSSRTYTKTYQLIN